MFIAIYLALGILVMQSHADADELSQALKKAFAAKGKSFPYYADYDLAMPPQPRIAGATEKRQFLCKSRDVLYAEKTSEVHASRMLLKGGELFWEYWDTTLGTELLKASVNLGTQSPEVWLSKHSFYDNSFADLDEDLVLALHDLFAGCQPARRNGPGQEHTLIWSGNTGDELSIRFSASEVHIVAKKIGRGNLKTILRYDYQEGESPRKTNAQGDFFGKIRQGKERQHSCPKGRHYLRNCA